MLKDCLEIFNRLYGSTIEDRIIENYKLVEGSYVLVDEKGDYDVLEVSKNDDKVDHRYNEFAKLDYLSKLVDMNKPIDSKKVIHSNNYLSFFIKKDNVNKEKLKEEIIDNYYKILSDPREKYNKDKEKLKMYEAIESKYGKADAEKLEKNKKWIKENIYTVLSEVKKDKNYLKVFFASSLSLYKQESEKYVIPNIYNNTQYNVQVENETLGLPNDNLGLNSKKPYLEQKTRKNIRPYLISEKEVMLQKQFFDYLMNFASLGKTNIYLNEERIYRLANDESMEEDFSGYFLRIQKGKELEIRDFDIISGLKNKIIGLKVTQVIPIAYGKSKPVLHLGNIDNIKTLKGQINELYFNKFLLSNFFTEPNDIRLNDYVVKENLLKSRDALFSWLYKGDTTVIRQLFNDISLSLIKNSITNDYIIKAKEQFNLRYAILNYFGGKKAMGDIFKGIADSLRIKSNADKTDQITSDEEYYFAVGQIVSYLISLNKSSRKMHSLINPVLNCKTNDKLKHEIKVLFMKYNYAIRKDNPRFNNLKCMLLGYVPEGKIDTDILLGGYLYSNLIYEKSKGTDVSNEIEEDKENE
ncbi:CRISPR-associated protein Cse4 [Clostridium sp. 19966]|uniref:CRISPR-associated protein Cse4 n=1 Tax=Clostridium sp. 19966 TaxID=2768166 RepID=UPI0028DE5827|nr:CRISPR-associated protein Cse4 [Clostridium sp. 19966]MDT8719415.1 CRISPR-associated protein Cse4 [Clostridium sp. 19966]